MKFFGCKLLAGISLLGFASFSIHALAGEGPRSSAAWTMTCRQESIPVGLTSDGSKPYRIAGELCYRGSHQPPVVQLLVHGATYNHLYWNFPYEQPLYSYVDDATLVGYATFAIDNLGTGASSHPLSTLLTVDADAAALHDVVQALRAGSASVPSFRQVVLVAHSFGSITSWVEAGTYHDVDGVIISSALHQVSALQVAQIFSVLYPGALDPHFAGQILDPGYLTTQPGTRGSIFYYAPTADPGVIATDEANKDLFPATEAASAFPLVEAPLPLTAPSLRINVPVLVAIGQEDNFFCRIDAVDCSSKQSVQQAEAPYNSPQAQLQVVLFPNTGHDLNLHESAQMFYSSALAWAVTHVPPR